MNGIPRELMLKINECAQRHGLSASEYFIALILAELIGSGIEPEEIKSDSAPKQVAANSATANPSPLPEAKPVYCATPQAASTGHWLRTLAAALSAISRMFSSARASSSDSLLSRASSEAAFCHWVEFGGSEGLLHHPSLELDLDRLSRLGCHVDSLPIDQFVQPGNGDEVPALKDLKEDIGNMLNKAIAAVEDENDALAGVLKNNIDFNAVKGKTKIPDQKWKNLLDYFNHPQFVLVNDNFEFPNLLGAAYEYLIKYFADSAGKKGGEFYTPVEVVRLLVQLVKPGAGQEIYDPTVGSGGFLIQSHQYLEEQGENPNDLALYAPGSEKSGMPKNLSGEDFRQ
jgi:N-6 DNA Methylase/HsdM N-terminal domain